MKFKRAFDPSADDPGLDTGPGLTEQHHQDRVDINNIMARYTISGQLPDVRHIEGVYGDFSDVGDFLETQLKIKAAEDAFMALPAHVRKRFANDPANLMEFLHNPENQEEAIKLGLANKKTTEPSLEETSKQNLTKQNNPHNTTNPTQHNTTQQNS